MRQLLVWLATAAALQFALPGHAAQKGPRLDGLFERLKAATSEAEAEPIEQAIWRIWLHYGDEDIDRLMALGLRAMAQRRPLDALVVFDELVGRAPDFAEAWNKRATVYYLLGRLEESAADIRRTLALEPRHFGALSGLGLVRLAEGEEEAALEAFERALAVYPMLSGHDTHIKALREKLRGRGI